MSTEIWYLLFNNEKKLLGTPFVTQAPHIGSLKVASRKRHFHTWRMSRLSIWSFGGARNLRCCPLKTRISYMNIFWKSILAIENKLSNLTAVQKLQISSLVKGGVAGRSSWCNFKFIFLLLFSIAFSSCNKFRI